jgi:hypothetical protein
MANFLGGGLLAGGAGSFVIRQATAGIFKRYAKEWDLAKVQEAAENQWDLKRLFSDNPEWMPALEGAMIKYPAIRKLEANELLGWLKDANPRLFREMVADPPLIAWFFKAWDDFQQSIESMLP